MSHASQFNFELLKTPQQARNLMQNAIKQNNMDVYKGGFKKYCILASQKDLENKDINNPVIVKFWYMIAALEQIIFEKNGKANQAIRTRRKVKEHDEFYVLNDWAMNEKYQDGFIKLAQKGLLDLTGEAIVVSHPDQFEPEVVAAAQTKIHNFQ